MIMAPGSLRNSLSRHAPGWSLLIVVLLVPATANAHRLDEYLQATRVAIERDRVVVDVDLTPGISIARRVTGWIDLNSDGEISSSESLAYGREVLGSLVLSVDGATMPLGLIETQAPTIADMANGVGTVRVRASAAMASRGTGRHELTVVNTHRPESSVYLANALVPSDKGVEIVGQRRSHDQHSLTIEYDVETSAFRARVLWLGAAFTLFGAALWRRRRLGHFSHRQTQPI
jgi:hypothetical protein